MLKRIIITIAMLVSTPIAFGSSKTQPLLLEVGKPFSLSEQSAGPLHVSNGKILRARVVGSRILLLGLTKGNAILRVGNREVPVEVLTPASFASFTTLSRSMARRKGLELIVTGGEVRIKGELLTCEDWKELGEEVAQVSGEFLFETKVLESVRPCLTAHFKELLARDRLSNAALQFTPYARALVATTDAETLQSYRRTLSPYGFAVEAAPNSLSLEPMVEVELNITEVRKSSFQKLGVDLPTTYKAGILPSSWSGTGTAARSSAPIDMSVYLHALEQSGDLKILASPKLTCRSGKEASFLAGGEFPIKIVNFQVNDVVWKRYGVMLNIKPRADSTGRMSIELQTEISSVDDSVTVDGLPGLLTNRVSSHFDLESTRTIALSGLIKNEEGRSKSGLAFLQRLPILGLLFSSEQFKNNRTELVIFVTPKVQLVNE